MSDAMPCECQEDRVTRRVVPDLADELDSSTLGCRGGGDRGSKTGRVRVRPGPTQPQRSDDDDHAVRLLDQADFSGQSTRPAAVRFASTPVPRSTLIVPPLPLISNVSAMIWSVISVPPLPLSFTWPPGT